MRALSPARVDICKYVALCDDARSPLSLTCYSISFVASASIFLYIYINRESDFLILAPGVGPSVGDFTRVMKRISKNQLESVVFRGLNRTG